VKIDRRLRSSAIDATMLLQIHDELIFEVAKADAKALAALVRDEMEHAIELTVPLEVTVKAGTNWYDVEALVDD